MQILWQMNKALPVVLGVLVLMSITLFAVDTWVLTPDLQKLQRTYIAQRQMVHRTDPGRQVSLAKRLQGDREDLAAFRQTVGGYDEFTGFIGELFNLARQAGLSIDQVLYKPEGVPEYRLLRYDLSFSVSGDYGEIKKFIFSLEQSPRIIVIEEVVLVGANKAERSSVNLKIGLSTYFATDNS
ncbi:MAG: type 4a pilus biogenesis protein PilO [Desulfuromonadales bacterium]|nr:type 4a pilus biogenesis protein PilO [Desulfuromonadales bacterium]